MYNLLGVTPMGRIAVDISKPANRVTRTVWPGVLELHNIEEIDEREVRRWADLFPRASEIHLYGGFPCVHLSAVRAYRKNLDGEGSKLFWKLLEVIGLVQKVFKPTCKVKFCVENVASMDEEARMAISQELDVCPIKLDPADCMPISRPRFAWMSEEVHQMDGLQLWPEKEYIRGYISVDAAIENHQWIRPGWTWRGNPSSERFPTFMKAIKRRVPPPYPAGLHKASQSMVDMWTNDQYRYPPYQYNPRFWLHAPGQPVRLLDASERELLLGFGLGHTEPCQAASLKKKSLQEHEDIRCSLCGDSFAMVPFTVMGAVLCQDLVPRMSPTQVLLRLGLAPGASCHPDLVVPLSRWLAYGAAPTTPADAVEMVKNLGLSVNHTGSDVRVISGQVLSHRPPHHASVRALWWQWKQLFNVKWRNCAHINFLEMKMVLLTLLWKCRAPSAVKRRWLHLEDSMVSLLILCKGRTSSKLLQPLTNKIGAIQLAMGSFLLHGHVGSDENPTDAASRL